MLSLVPIPNMLARFPASIAALKRRSNHRQLQEASKPIHVQASHPHPRSSTTSATMPTSEDSSESKEWLAARYSAESSESKEQLPPGAPTVPSFFPSANNAIQSTIFFGIHTSVFAINLFFSTLSPLMLVFGMLYFGLAFPISRYLLIYVHESKDDRGSV